MAKFFQPKKWNALGYEEYIVTNLEVSSIVVIAVTLYLLFCLKVGLFLSMLPCTAFHVIAYCMYRSSPAVKAACLTCLDFKAIEHEHINGPDRYKICGCCEGLDNGR